MQCAGLLAVPFTAIRIAPLLESGQASPLSPWLPWASIGLSAVALYLFIAPVVFQLLRWKSRQVQEALERAHIDPDRLSLYLGAGAPAAASMTPVIILSLGGESGRFVVPWATACFISAVFWCWRFRRVLL